MPRTAILYIAERCNQRCVFCLEEDGGWREFVDPSTLEVFGVLDRLFERGARHITFMGGETFFRKDLPRILSRAREVGYTRIGVTTNGTVLSKKGFVAELVAAGLEFIELSIHGHTPELANAIGGTGFTFGRQREALAEIEASGRKTIVNVVICRQNKDHLRDVARYVLDDFPGIAARFKFKFVSLQGLAAVHEGEGEAPLGYDEVDFVALGDELVVRGAAFWFYNVPLCRLGRHASHAHEVATLAVDEAYFDFDHRSDVGYYDSGHQLEGRVWPASTCGGCTLRAACPGVEASYLRARSARTLGLGLSTRADDAVPLVAFALGERGLDPAGAAARLAELARAPRPEIFVPPRPDGAVRFVRAGEAEPLDVVVEGRVEGARAFFTTPRFALSYRAWSEGPALGRPSAARLLDAAARCLARSDDAGESLESARAAIAKAAVEGWTAEPPRPAHPRAPRGSLPVLPPD
jgi:pyruvate-formate lyase-activating enzyme